MTAPNMTYHNNQVFVRSDYSTPIQSGTFTITDFRITDGQDPDGHISKGMVHKWDGSFAFVIGRKGSSDVASWFSAKIKASETNFGYEPKGLNFALMGNLQLTVKTGTSTINFDFDNFCFAQGHWLVYNTWWVGIPGGKHVTSSVETLDKSGAYMCKFETNTTVVDVVRFTFTSPHTVHEQN